MEITTTQEPTMPVTMTVTQRRVLSAVQLAQAAGDADMVGLLDVKCALAVNRRGRHKLTDDQIRSALARLVVTGELRRISIAGLGGQSSAWGIAQ